MKTKFILAIILGLNLVACKKDAIERVETNNSDFKVDLLFEVDGTKVYRFSDNGELRYFTSTPGTSAMWAESKGKHKEWMEVHNTLDTLTSNE